AVVNVTTASTASVQTYVDGYLAGPGASQLAGYNKTTSISVFLADPTTGQDTGTSWTSATWGAGIGVSVPGTYNPITPGLLRLHPSLPIKATCVMTSEAN